jgi:hypothetical protein
MQQLTHSREQSTSWEAKSTLKETPHILWIMKFHYRCGLLKEKSLLNNNYSKHIYWIFISLCCTAEYLCVAAESCDLIAPVVWSGHHKRVPVAEMCHGLRSRELVRAAVSEAALSAGQVRGWVQLAVSPRLTWVCPAQRCVVTPLGVSSVAVRSNIFTPFVSWAVNVVRRTNQRANWGRRPRSVQPFLRWLRRPIDQTGFLVGIATQESASCRDQHGDTVHMLGIQVTCN